MKTYAKQAVLMGLAIFGLALAGCHSVCKKNEKAGIAHIICQPMDVVAGEGEKAVFEVRLRVKEANYQWYHNGSAVNPTYTSGGNSNRLTVEVRGETLGDYSCEIETMWGEFVHTRTRIARLYLGSPHRSFASVGTGPRVLAATNLTSGGIPPTPGYPPSSPPVTNTICGSPFCTFVLYPQTPGVVFTPRLGTTGYVAMVRLGSSTAPPLSNLHYALTRVKFPIPECATNIGSVEKGGPCTAAGQRFTVYLKPGFCDTNNYPVFLEVKWLP